VRQSVVTDRQISAPENTSNLMKCKFLLIDEAFGRRLTLRSAAADNAARCPYLRFRQRQKSQFLPAPTNEKVRLIRALMVRLRIATIQPCRKFQ
jgi:hypothetical protein